MIGHLTNFWHGTTTNQFLKGLTPAGDGYPIGKMATMEQESVLKNPGLMSLVVPDYPLHGEDALRWKRSFLTSFSYDAFIHKEEIKRTREYHSKIGLNAFFYGLLNVGFSPDPMYYLKFIYFQKSLLFSLMLVFLIFWVRYFAGNFTAVLLTGCLMICPVITLMAGSLYYVPFAFLLPVVVPIYLLHNEYVGYSKFGVKAFLFCALAFLINLLFNSFEIISTIGLLSIIPFIFYGLLMGNYRTMIKRVLAMGIVNLLLCVVVILLVALQYGVANETSYSEGLDYIQQRFLNRATDSELAANAHPNLRLSKEIPYIEVIKNTLKAPAMSINGDWYPKWGIKYLAFIIVFAIASLLSLHNIKSSLVKRAVLITSWISLLAPLSWFILFKPHSYLHIHIVVFNWWLPFMFFGFILISLTIKDLLALRTQKVSTT